MSGDGDGDGGLLGCRGPGEAPSYSLRPSTSCQGWVVFIGNGRGEGGLGDLFCGGHKRRDIDVAVYATISGEVALEA